MSDPLQDATPEQLGGKVLPSDNSNPVSVLLEESTKVIKTNSLNTYALSGMFFNFDSIDPADAFRVYPYEFVIFDTKTRKAVMSLRLPLNPTDISISVPVASTLRVLMDGITEEHNAAPIRNITISGTSGVRPESIKGLTTPGIDNALNYLFKNTITTVNRTVASAQRAISTLTGQQAASPLLDPEGDYTSGYEVIHKLQRFLDWYLEAKKAGNSSLRLVFHMHKDKMFYYTKLDSYNIRKSAGTVEYFYNISMTAWKRLPKPVTEFTPATGFNGRPAVQEGQANVFARITESLIQARKTVSNAYSILSGFRDDIDQSILSPIRQLSLLMGDLAGVIGGFTLASYSNGIKQQFKSTWRGLLTSRSSLRDTLQSTNPLGSEESINKRGIYRTADNQTPENTQGVDEDGNIPIQQPIPPNEALLTASPDEDIFNNPNEYDAFFDGFNVSNPDLPENLREAIEAENTAASNLTVDNVRNMLSKFEVAAADIITALGGGNETVNRVFGLTRPVILRDLTPEDIEIINQLNESQILMEKIINQLNELEGTGQDDDFAAYYANYARTNGINFESSVSKFYVPFPSGGSLQSLAVQYLGDVNRWIEIAAINALKEPYVDEDGFTLPMISSGAGNTILISEPTDLFVGQLIFVESDTQRPTLRKIESIQILNISETIVTVSGDSNLFLYRLEENARIRAFKPNTVNSNMMIAIPSSIPVNIPGKIRLNPNEEDLTTIALTAKSDFALSFSNNQLSDIIIEGNDFKIARGMQNLVQAALIKLKTNTGDLLHDPEFGNPIQIGSSVADISASRTLATLSAVFNDDPRFTGIVGAKINVTGGSIPMDLLIGVAGSGAYLPLTTELPRF